MADDAATGSPPVLVERDGHVLVVTLNRPEVHNAVDHQTADLLGAAVEEATADRAVRVLVLTGAGGRAFSAGADLRAAGGGGPIVASGHPEWGFAGFVRHFTPVPTVAAVEGWALGGGTELCLACDLVVAARGARFGMPEVRRGIVPGGGGPVRLPAQLPFKRALELLFTGEELAAEDAHALGLVNRVVGDGEALARALELARRIGESAPLAVQAAKRVAWGRDGGGGGGGELEESRWRQSDRERHAIAATDDAKEGVTAFLEKRAPRWRGA